MEPREVFRFILENIQYQIQLLHLLVLTASSFLYNQESSFEKKILKRYKMDSLRKKVEKKKSRQKKHKTRNKSTIKVDSFYEDTGIFEDDFIELYENMKPNLENYNLDMTFKKKKCSSSLTLMSQVHLTLFFYRTNEDYRSIAKKFEISKSEVPRIIQKVSLVMNKHLKGNVKFKEKFYLVLNNLVNGALDCGISQRNRIHPGQEIYYRGLKDKFNIR
jgi:hypothetical protein